MSFDCDVVPERRLIFEIQDRRLVVCQDKREDWILHKVVERPPCQFVELHQVVKVCDSPCVRNKSSISRHDCDVSTVSTSRRLPSLPPASITMLSGTNLLAIISSAFPRREVAWPERVVQRSGGLENSPSASCLRTPGV